MREISVEALLTWAYRDELAKRDFLDSGGVGGWSLETIARLGTTVSGGRPPCYAELIGKGIHADALKAEEAVLALEPLTLAMADPWTLLADMGRELMELAPAALRGFDLQLDVLVTRLAKLNQVLEWHFPAPVKKTVKNGRGGPAWFRMVRVDDLTQKEAVNVGKRAGGHHMQEVDGWNPRRRHPYPDAYQKMFFDPDPAAIVDARAEYAAWRLALMRIVESIRHDLVYWKLNPVDPASIMPWTMRPLAASLVERQAPEPQGEVVVKGRSARWVSHKRA